MSIPVADVELHGLTEVLREEAYYVFRSKTGTAYASFDGSTVTKLEGSDATSLTVSWFLIHGKAYLNNAVELKSTRYWVK